MKISILGTNGFLSTAIAKYANEIGWELDMYGLEKPTSHDYARFFQVDMTDSKLDYSGLLSSDLIVYGIGAGIQSNLKEDFNLIYNLNVMVPLTICNKLKEFDYRGIFVTFGSVFEMGETNEERFFTEEDLLKSTCDAPNDYTISKRMFSRFVSSYKHKFTHWHFFIPTIYGSGENPKRLIPYVINSIHNGDKVHFTSGEQTRQYLHVSEVPRLLDMAYKNSLPSGLYNVKGNETMTIKEIVSIIYNAMGKKVPDGSFGSVQRADQGMRYLALDGYKLKNILGFEAKIQIIDTITTY